MSAAAAPGAGKLRVLLVTYCFPPMNTIASHRPYGWARAWRDLGHEVHVLTPAKRGYDGYMDLECNLAGIQVHESGSRPASARAASPLAAGKTGLESWERLKGITRRARFSLAMFGDPRLLAYFALVREGARLLRSQPFDLIVATSPPEVAFFAARALSRRTGVPWVADFRDLWFQDLRLHQSAVASWLSGIVQTRLVRSAAALVTVSAGLQERLSRHASREVLLSYNGPFEDADTRPQPAPARPWPAGEVHLVYTGHVYKGRQDPEPLFRALAALDDEGDPAARRLRVDFYGHDEAWLSGLAARYRLGDRVRFHGFVPHRESLAAQRAADAVLFLDWTAPTARGMLTGKLFEYLACGRPIIALGRRTDTEAAELIAGTRCGETLTSEEQIVAFLKRASAGTRLPDVDTSAARRYSRAEQARALIAALQARLDLRVRRGERN